jgi:hypothetical protein
MNMSMESIAEQVRADIAKLTQILRLIEGLEETQPVKRATVSEKKPRRIMSAAARKKIAIAQRLRWKKIRAGKK